PRQLNRQPGRERGGLRAAGEYRRSRPDHLLLDSRGRARLGSVALALGGSLGPLVHDCPMSRARKAKTPSKTAQRPEPVGDDAPTRDAAAVAPADAEALATRAPPPRTEAAPAASKASAEARKAVKAKESKEPKPPKDAKEPRDAKEAKDAKPKEPK